MSSSPFATSASIVPQNTTSAANAMDEQYNKLRRKLKRWEEAFQAKYSRRPELQDIQKHSEVAHLYKTYAQLKKALQFSDLSQSSKRGCLSSTAIHRDEPKTPSKKTVISQLMYKQAASPLVAPRSASRKSSTHSINENSLNFPDPGNNQVQGASSLFSKVTTPSKGKSITLRFDDQDIVEPSPLKYTKKSIFLAAASPLVPCVKKKHPPITNEQAHIPAFFQDQKNLGIVQTSLLIETEKFETLHFLENIDALAEPASKRHLMPSSLPAEFKTFGRFLNKDPARIAHKEDEDNMSKATAGVELTENTGSAGAYGGNIKQLLAEDSGLALKPVSAIGSSFNDRDRMNSESLPTSSLSQMRKLFSRPSLLPERKVIPGSTFINPRSFQRQSTFSLDAILPQEERRKLEERQSKSLSGFSGVIAPAKKKSKPSSLSVTGLLAPEVMEDERSSQTNAISNSEVVLDLMDNKSIELDVSRSDHLNEHLSMPSDNLAKSYLNKRSPAITKTSRQQPARRTRTSRRMEMLSDDNDEEEYAEGAKIYENNDSPSEDNDSASGEDGDEPSSDIVQSKPQRQSKSVVSKPSEPKQTVLKKRKAAASTKKTITIRERVDVKRTRSDHKPGLGATSNTNYRSMNLQRGFKKGRGGKKFSKAPKYTYTKVEVAEMASGYDEEQIPSNAVPYDEDEDALMQESGTRSPNFNTIKSRDFIQYGTFDKLENHPFVVKVCPEYLVSPESDEDVYADCLIALTALTGFTSFRPGQFEALSKILMGKSTILVSPTGSGKSLVYQLPAFIFRHIAEAQPCVTLVISPMISLMQDQLRCLSRGLRGICLSSVQQSAAQTKMLMQRLGSNDVDVLFITPEKLSSDSFLELVKSGSIPRIKFACIDEVHCISEWSHNFRPAYLYLKASLRDKLGVGCILGLTGTIVPAAKTSICRILHIDEADVVHNSSVLRENLKLTISWVQSNDNREALLVLLLKTPVFSTLSSIIIYTMFQVQADSVAAYLRIRNLQAESYHSGKSHDERTSIQNNFMSGKLRIIVATVAFGLGVNKADVRSVIHFSMPKNLESYIQEIGRAGRDGKVAHCHLFFCQNDYMKHRSLCFSEGMDPEMIRGFVGKIFSSANFKSSSVNSPILLALPIEECEKEFDMKEGVLTTILACLELNCDEDIKLLSPINAQYLVKFIKSAVETLADGNPVVNGIMKYGSLASIANRNAYEFEMIRLCDSLNMPASEITSALFDLRRKKEIAFEGSVKSFHISVPGKSISKKQLASISSTLWNIFYVLENAKADKLDDMYQIFHQFSLDSIPSFDIPPSSFENEGTSLLDEFSLKLLEYFARDTNQVRINPGFADPALQEYHTNMKLNLELTLHKFVKEHPEITSGRAIARIFHGITSPKYPAYEWSRSKEWASYTMFAFQDLMRIANILLARSAQKSNPK